MRRISAATSLPKGWQDVQFDADGLVPVVAQDINTGRVLMLAYANAEALSMALATHRGVYWSRSRHELWIKGSTSGNSQRVVEVSLDCDGDAVLYLVDQQGPACHTGAESCFDVGPCMTFIGGDNA